MSLWFTDGARFGCVDARIDRRLGLEIRQREMGTGNTDQRGDDSALCLEPEAVAELALALLAERYSGQADALSAIEALCQAARIWTSHRVLERSPSPTQGEGLSSWPDPGPQSGRP